MLFWGWFDVGKCFCVKREGARTSVVAGILTFYVLRFTLYSVTDAVMNCTLSKKSVGTIA